MTNLKEFGRKRSCSNFKALSRHSPGGTEENHKKYQPEQSVSGPRFETGTSRIRSRSVNHSTPDFRCDLCRSDSNPCDFTNSIIPIDCIYSIY
jgi:hypothetical protein